MERLHMTAVQAGCRKALDQQWVGPSLFAQTCREKPQLLCASYNSNNETVCIPDGAFSGQTTQTVESSIANESEC